MLKSALGDYQGFYLLLPGLRGVAQARAFPFVGRAVPLQVGFRGNVRELLLFLRCNMNVARHFSDCGCRESGVREKFKKLCLFRKTFKSTLEAYLHRHE